MRRLLRLAAATVLACGGSGAARSQVLDQILTPDIPGAANEPGVTVTSRVRPDYSSLGVRLGSLVIHPDVTQSYGYDDNATGTTQGRGSSLLLSRASLQAASDLSRYGVTTGLTVEDFRYFDQPKQSLTNWTASIGAYYELGRDTVTLDYTHLNLNQSPRDLDTPLLNQPIAYRIDTVRSTYRATFNRLFVRPEIAVSLYDFDNGIVAGVPYPQQFRNRVVVAPGVTAGYELAPRRNVVVVVRNLTASYSRPLAGTPQRNFNDTSVLAGLDYGGTGPWRFRALAGYEVRTFSSPAIKTIQAPIVEGTLIYTPTGLTTLTGTVARRIQDSADETTTGFTETSVKLGVDHEYRRNVLLRGQAGIYIDEFNGSTSQQLLYSVGAGATWLLNRNVRLGATYDFTTRQTIGATQTVLAVGTRLGNGFSESRYLLQLSLGL